MTDQTRQMELAHSLGQRARKRAEERIRAVNDQLNAERTQRHRAIDEDLAKELAGIRARCQSGLLTEDDLLS